VAFLPFLNNIVLHALERGREGGGGLFSSISVWAVSSSKCDYMHTHDIDLTAKRWIENYHRTTNGRKEERKANKQP